MRNIRWLLAVITAVHRFVYRVSGGRLGNSLGGMPMLLLTNVGRKSGKQRVTPLLYVEDGARWVVVASNAGDDRDPAWWLNVQSHPDTSIQLGAARHDVRARRASPDEVEQIWPRLLAAYPPYDEYRDRTSREIPVVFLERRSTAARG